MGEQVRHHPSTVVIGPLGVHIVIPGYTEIGKLRYYDDQVVVGPRGEHWIRRGDVRMLP